MADIKTIPTPELVKDRYESIDDIGLCKKALENGITVYSGGTVRERLRVNEEIVRKIDDELKRRESRG